MIGACCGLLVVSSLLPGPGCIRCLHGTVANDAGGTAGYIVGTSVDGALRGSTCVGHWPLEWLPWHALVAAWPWQVRNDIALCSGTWAL
jgi:hypothetical protein